MARMNIPLDALTSRLNLSGRFDSVRSQSLSNRFANLKPVGEFFDLKRLGKPKDFGELQSRANYNLSYFSSNYAVVFVMLSIYSLLTNLLLLFVIILVVGGMFGISKLQGSDLDLGFARFTSSQMYTGLLIVSVPLGIWASPITTVLWLVGASAVTILGHASLMDRPIEASFSEYGLPPTTMTRTSANTLTAGRRFKDRSAAHSQPYDTGRPPGALDDHGRRRRYPPEDWELRNSAAARYGERFEELVESDDEDGQGVLLDPNGYAPRRDSRRGFASDELYFDGYDIGQDRQRRRQVYDYADELDSEEEAFRRRGAAFQATVREKDEGLVQAALERIARARAKGKTNVNLSTEEMEALERRRGQPPEPPPPLPVPLVSPPATPAKTPKGKAGSRSSSSTSLASQKTKKKGSSLSSPSPAKSNSKAKVDRKPSNEHASPYSTGTGPPGIMVPGPNGVPIFAPLVNYPPPSPEFARAQPAGRSRSNSKPSRRESTPPERADPYNIQYSPRYYMPQAGVRPPSSGSTQSNRSIPDDVDWYPPPTRNRSASSAQYAAYRPPPPDDYDASPMPAAHGRYASLRRAPPSSSPLAPRPGAQHANSDPTFAGAGRKASALGQELERTSSSSSDDQGVQVNIVPDGSGGGYSVNRAGGATSAAAAASAGGGQGRRRRSGRR